MFGCLNTILPKMIKLTKNIEIAGKGLWLKKERALILADIHIGYEEALNKQGILVPRTQFKKIEIEVKELIEKLRPKEIIINGDLKHEFGEISNQEWAETIELIDLMTKQSKVVLIQGNHDKVLGPIARKRNLEVKEYYCLSDTCVVHGDKIIENLDTSRAKILIIGHEHPAISLIEGAKLERYKCFLLGKWKTRKLIVMPSFLPLVEGTDLRKEKLLSPYLKQNLNNFEVFIVGDKTYKFGKLKNL